MHDAPRFGFEIISFERNELDATNEDQVREKINATRCDILINAAAYHVVADCEKNLEEAMRVNFAAVVRMARLCKERMIPFVTYSTFSVFDGETNAPYAEEDMPRPLQMYSISKLAGEYGARVAYPEGAFIIRTGALYGGASTGSPDKGGNFVLGILKDLETKKKIEVSAEQIMNPTFAGDLSSATLDLLGKHAPAGIYHLANEGYCSYADFAQEIVLHAGSDAIIMPVDRGGKSGSFQRSRFAALKNIKGAARGVIMPPWKEGLKSYMASLNESSKNERH